MNLREEVDRANLAQALLALANHGGGFAVLGFAEEGGAWVRAPGGPPDDGAYNQDTVNEIVKKYADPPFQCEARRIARGDATHLVVAVPGEHRVPVRARAGGPADKHVKKDTYYIRRPGPESAPIQSAAEWDTLIRRCMQAAKDELADLIRAAVLGSPAVAAPTTSARLAEWVKSSEDRLKRLVAENLADEQPGRYSRGVWTFSYALEDPIDLSLPRLAEVVQLANGRVTGWPTFIVMTKEAFAPYPFEGSMEAWIHEPGRLPDGWHSDFWRASRDGRLFLLRGYQEDGDIARVEPGSALDRGLPIWRMGECLLHVQRFAQLVDRGSGRAVVRAEWTGLKGRRLGDLAGDWPTGPEGRPCRQERVTSEVPVDVATIRAALGDLVGKLTEPLYAAFDFSTVPRERIEAELQKLLRRA